MQESPSGEAGHFAGQPSQVWTSLQRLCSAAIEAVPVHGVAVIAMTDVDKSELVFASDSVASRLDEVQFALGEGPAIDAFRDGYPVLVPDLEGRSGAFQHGAGWPAFSGAAREAGARAVFALPLQLGAIRVGVLVLYRAEPGELEAAGLARALRLADATTYALLAPLAIASNLQGAPVSAIDGIDDLDEFIESRYRAAVHQATGVLAVQLGIGLEAALARLRAHAFAEGLALSEVARLVIAGDLRLEGQ